MGRKKKRGPPGTSQREGERSLAAAEADAAPGEPADGEGGEEGGEAPAVARTGASTCLCGSSEFLLEAYLHVVDGVPRPAPLEVERLTCPECEREFEAIQGEGGRILRGDFLGFAAADDEDEDDD